MKPQVNYIRWKREDAIGKVTTILLDKLKSDIELNLITLENPKGNILLKNFQRLKNAIKIIRVIRDKKIVHFEEPKHLEMVLNIFYRNKQSILTVHHTEDSKNKSLDKYIYKKLHNSFQKLIAISDKTKEDLMREYGVNANKIVVVQFGVDKSIFRPTKRKISSYLSKYILYLGSEIPRKNIENLLKAFKEVSTRHPELILIKAGYSGGNKERNNTLYLIEKYNLQKKVIFTQEHLKEVDLPKYYSNAELFLYPTLKEGFGMPLVEAMACGCPVVTSNLAPMKDIASGQVLVNPYNYKDIAKGIEKILRDKKYQKVLKKKAIERAKDFDWNNTAKQYFEVYNSLTK